jgi:anti-sigma regulatory factor (Ser/Thr protein kinase)
MEKIVFAPPASLHAINSLARRQKLFSMSHASEVSAARRYGQLLAEQINLTAIEAGRLAIMVTEAGTNIVKHATDGCLILNITQQHGRLGIEVLALDKGPGIANVSQSLRDGVSSTGTAGTGLGAIRRQADGFDIYSQMEQGTALYMLVLAGSDGAGGAAPTPPAPTTQFASADSTNRSNPSVGSTTVPNNLSVQNQRQRLCIGAVCLPLLGEESCGDAWAVDIHSDGATVLMVDGLGHGDGAADAALAAISAFDNQATQTPEALMWSMHESLRATRGAAMEIAHLDYLRNEITFVGIGNLTALILDNHERHQMVSHNGIVGHNLRKVQSFQGAWRAASSCILCSDGISTQWNLDHYPALSACHPSLIAGVLYRDFRRLRDDSMVVVIQRLF